MDFISREQAIKEICREVNEEESNAIPGEDLDVGVIVGLKMAVRIIKEQPSAEKTSRWVGNGFDPLHCSVCGKGSDGLLGIPWANKSFNYCPNCGAKMEVEHEIN